MKCWFNKKLLRYAAKKSTIKFDDYKQSLFVHGNATTQSAFHLTEHVFEWGRNPFTVNLPYVKGIL